MAHACAVADAEHLPAEFRHAYYLDADLGANFDATLLVYRQLSIVDGSAAAKDFYEAYAIF